LPSFESQLGFRCLCVRIFLCSSFLDLAQCRSREIIDLAPGRSQSSALIREQGSPAQALTLPQPVRFLCSPDFKSPLAPLVFPRQSVSDFWTTCGSAQPVLLAERAASFEFFCCRSSCPARGLPVQANRAPPVPRASPAAASTFRSSGLRSFTPVGPSLQLIGVTPPDKKLRP
jgi:hypothetical protein